MDLIYTAYSYTLGNSNRFILNINTVYFFNVFETLKN